MPARSAAAGPDRIRRIAIVGGGTAGWMTASILARALPGSNAWITVVESPDIGTVGVGEATIPPFLDLLRFLSINEADFIRHTQATFKLGIKFTDWMERGGSYWHPFGTFGESINRRPFHHAWHRARAAGLAPRLSDFSLCAALGDAGRFRFTDAAAAGPVAGLRYALHFDAALVARYLRSYAEQLGVLCLQRTVTAATQAADGFLEELVMSDGSRVAADLFIDCSGFRGLLIGQSLKTGYIDWREQLPCDRAVAVQTGLGATRPPYTESTAHGAGWRWRIPLQERIGNGSVYSSAHISDQQALDDLIKSLPERPSTVPRVLKFVAGRRRLVWNRNCVAIGLASGFLEPLESTSIHLIISGVFRLLEFFPDTAFEQRNIDAYNAESIDEIESIRDFIVLHYCLTQRRDTPFWVHCASLPLTDSLRQRIELYRETGRLRIKAGELFTDASWFYILEGMGVRPQRTDPLLDVVDPRQLSGMLETLSRAVATAAADSPSHDSFFNDPRSALCSGASS